MPLSVRRMQRTGEFFKQHPQGKKNAAYRTELSLSMPTKHMTNDCSGKNYDKRALELFLTDQWTTLAIAPHTIFLSG